MVTDELLARARAGDGAAFGELTEPYRRELQLHCYRMLGTISDAEDLVQETLLSAWRSVGGFRGKASVRTWLYRIATNRCLNALRDAERRPLPAAPPSSGFLPPEPSRLGEAMWLEPYPDLLLSHVDDAALEPEGRIESRESISLAFITAVQTLPPRQRAILVLRDVLSFRGPEVASMLSTTENAVASGLKRARATLGARTDTERARRPPLPGSDNEQRIVAAFVAAFENGDVPALISLLTDDAWLTMPPVPLEYQGHAAIAAFFTHFGFREGARSFRLIPTRANGQPAFGRYTLDPHSGIARAHGLTVLSLDREKIALVASFVGANLPARFGLPASLRPRTSRAAW
jgi:RNA polymerase sigma-70 factor (TIGR02960 family)